jgi:NTE family protein
MRKKKPGLIPFLINTVFAKNSRKEKTGNAVPAKKYKTGLVLSGGGARGIAHIGAVKALYEQGLTFDVIIGSSMGAIVGCVLADGHLPDDIINIMTRNPLLSFIRPEINQNGLMTMKGVQRALNKVLSVQNIEDLSIPFIAAATDLTHGKAHYFEKGSIVEAVVASASIPAVFPPVVINHVQYVDGGVLNNLPVRHIRDDCEKIAGFHVNPKSPGLDGGDAVRGIVHIADRAFNLCMSSNILPDIELCDFYLEHANLNRYSTFDFSKAAEIFQLGYENTKERLRTDFRKLQ